ncbi:anion exchange family protein [Histoplasma capsulatum var. duboisii H88]|uniref:Anion exchange family protein n=1 Tax=Ajellomyces capsulatus (strain H88) TaxID=544711 RepID=F0UDC4_AJEC8|nr:anion exchange family protein [Histoplasma capsulatum var. duboisii H88]
MSSPQQQPQQQPHSSRGSFSLPAGPNFHSSSSSHPSPSRTQQKKTWKSPSISSLHSSRAHPRRSSMRSTAPAAAEEAERTRNSQNLTRADSSGSTGTRRTSSSRDKWWHIHFFQGMIGDIKRRVPYYASDWKEAWDYRVVPATIYMYFANILPALAFSLDMFEKTNMSYGVNEVLLASVLGAVVFSLLAGQPLVIVGVTGPITVFNYTVYDIMSPTGVNYLGFMCWIGIWAMLMHWILAITNSCNALTYVTRFSCDIFGFYVAFIYLQKGIQVLTRQWGKSGEASAYLSIMVSLLVLMCAYICGAVGESNLFQRYIRKFIEDYGTPLTIVFFTGFVHIGRMKNVPVETLPTSKAFFPTLDRSWLVNFWDMDVRDIFLAIILIDKIVSSLIAQGTEFPLRKPAGFHWDLFLLGLTTGVAGILGIPFPNGLIPQAPFHTAALCVTRQVADEDETNKGKSVRVIDHVVEQRFSNLVQGLLTLVTMSGPLLTVLHLIPQGVMAGLFFVMGVQALLSNGMTQKIKFLAQDKKFTPASDPLKRIERKLAIWAFVGIELVGFGVTFAITQTIAAIGFPVFILILIPVRTFLLPHWFTQDELVALDAPTASPFTMESVGGAHGYGDSGVTVTPASGEGGGIFKYSDSAVEDELERGESFELHTRSSMRRRSRDEN